MLYALKMSTRKNKTSSHITLPILSTEHRRHRRSSPREGFIKTYYKMKIVLMRRINFL